MLIKKFDFTNAHPYQAPELPFYFLHARLWFLIAMARLAIDHPQEIAKYASVLKKVALDAEVPHVLLRHFAAQALLVCASSGSIVLSTTDNKALKAINKSPRRKKKTDKYRYDLFYQDRPDVIPKPEPEFHIDYYFGKEDVAMISDAFQRPGWETKDAMTAWVRKYDSQITHMHDSGGRSIPQRSYFNGMNTWHHLYGEQLGWHALYLAAGEFLAKYPVVQYPYLSSDSDPWSEWLRCELLTKNDGLWLADGVDRPPLDAQVNLFEKGEKELILTSDRIKLLSLLNIGSSVKEELVVAGDWRSVDDIGIHIMSALAPSHLSQKLALKLSQEDPFHMWLPQAEQYDSGEEYSRSEKEPYKPWIVLPSMEEARLDKTDVLGVNSVVRRLYFTKDINSMFSLKTLDPFKRIWTDQEGIVNVRSEAWGCNPTHDKEELFGAGRLVCSSNFLKNVLLKKNADLLVLIKLTRYRKGYGNSSNQYWHTTAVIRIRQSLDFDYYPGVANQLWQLVLP